ncbi:MAG TPA: hypothetical protein PLE60_14530 [Candidatus Latescibacteria bacterium]|nr:hypothetical protein [Candidatus Latescibacterota bacterium]
MSGYRRALLPFMLLRELWRGLRGLYRFAVRLYRSRVELPTGMGGNGRGQRRDRCACV